ncbi:MAG TPA: hypothetical protein VGH66_16185, partial [Acidimicrobiales bacterium]
MGLEPEPDRQVPAAVPPSSGASGPPVITPGPGPIATARPVPNGSPGRSGELAIETEGLVKSFGSVAAVDGIDLSVPTGSVYGFLGPNGSGKT